MKTISSSNRLMLMLSTIVILVCIPLIAMQFTAEVQWTGFDFIAATILLCACAGMLELLWRRIAAKSYRIVYCAGTLLLFLVIWIELAVGI